jgi:hypothetical protein
MKTRTKPTAKKRPTARNQTAKEWVAAHSVLGSATEKKKGILHAEAFWLLSKKAGISEKEVKALNLKAVKHNIQLARQFDAQIASSRLNRDEVFNELETQVPPPDLIPYGHPHLFPEECVKIDLAAPDDGLRFKEVNATGHGDTLLESTVSKKVTAGAWLYQFRAPETGTYRVRVHLWAVGNYYVIADDGPCNDKFAEIAATADLRVYYHYTPNQAAVFGTAQQSIAQHRVTNEAILSPLLFTSVVEAIHVPLVKDYDMSAVLTVYLKVVAKGGGSFAKVDLQSAAGGLWSSHAHYCYPKIGPVDTL